MQNVVPLSMHSDFIQRRHGFRAPLTNSPFPRDAQAVIYQPAPSPMTSGRAHLAQWKLRFERRSAPYIEPLMGWTAGDDTLTQVELSFPSMGSAIAYARRQGLQYTVQGVPERESGPRLVSDNPHAAEAAQAARNAGSGWNGSNGRWDPRCSAGGPVRGSIRPRATRILRPCCGIPILLRKENATCCGAGHSIPIRSRLSIPRANCCPSLPAFSR
jgi:ETC complex I subunit-like protein